MTADGVKKFAYYPGCSLGSSAAEYNHSTREVFSRLGVSLEEIPGWSCCGATSAHSLNREMAIALPARNLALAEPAGLDVVAPCASCYNRLRVTEAELAENPGLKSRIEEIMERPFNGRVHTLNTLELAVDHVGLDAIKEKAVKKLSGLKVVCYYGCLLVRPVKKLERGNPDNPVELDEIMSALGAEPRFWSYKTDCCGAGHTMARKDIVFTLVGKLIEMAREAGGEAIVTACPMCHANLEMRQDAEPKLPVFFFTELMALSMGIPEARSWLSKHFISPFPLLERLGLI